MLVKAVESFAGIRFSMARNEVRDIPEPLAADLMRAGYVEKEELPDEAKRGNNLRGKKLDRD